MKGGVKRGRLEPKETSYQRDISFRGKQVGTTSRFALRYKGLFKFAVEKLSRTCTINFPFWGFVFEQMCVTQKRKLYYKCKGKTPEVEEQLSFWKREIAVMEAYKRTTMVIDSLQKNARPSIKMQDCRISMLKMLVDS
jgi:hypothetical protein